MIQEQKKRVLIVDDEPELAGLLAFNLQHFGFETYIAAGGEEAFSKIQEIQDIDFVLSDVRMPKGSGVELLERIQASSGKRPKVILCSGYADITEDEIYKKGAACFLKKPVEIRELIKILMA